MRPRCPFYGFFLPRIPLEHWVKLVKPGDSRLPLTGVMIDTHGNQCALDHQAFSPCIMEMAGQTPVWEECPRYESGLVAAVEANDVQVFPEELMLDATVWDGVSFGEWAKRVLGEQQPPAEQRPAETAEDMMRRIAREEIDRRFAEHQSLLRKHLESVNRLLEVLGPTLSDLTQVIVRDGRVYDPEELVGLDPATWDADPDG